MTKPLPTPFENIPSLMAFANAPTIVRLAGAGPAGEILVEVGATAPCAARMTADVDRSALSQARNRGREVLVVFQDGDRNKPIIVGLMEEPLESLVNMEVSAPETPSHKQELRIDGKRLVIEADDEIELKCGQGSITIRKDGKIVLKGTNLLSRSSGPNRIKGGSISLN